MIKLLITGGAAIVAGLVYYFLSEMMKTTKKRSVSVFISPAALLFLFCGCATVKYDGFHREAIKTVSMSADVLCLAEQGSLMGVTPALMGGALGGLEAGMHDKRVAEEVKKAEFFESQAQAVITNAVYDSMMSNLLAAGIFPLVEADEGKPADARFIVVVRNQTYLGSTRKYKWESLDRQTPVLRMYVWLVANPPFNWSWNRSSRAEPFDSLLLENPGEHRIKWSHLVDLKGNDGELPEYTVDSYMGNPDAVQRAYRNACNNGVAEIIKKLRKDFGRK
mgnify:CR=1 FL=1